MAQSKKGRLPSDNPLKDKIFVRVNKETKDKLNKCTEELNTTRLAAVR